MEQVTMSRTSDVPRWQSALQRALEDALDVLVEPISGEAFVESASQPGVLYAVSREHCTCQAGARGIPCKHRACYLVQIGELRVDDGGAIGIDIEPARKPCFWCNGSGKVPNDYCRQYDVCDRCSGTGIRPDRRPQGQPPMEIVATTTNAAAA